MSETFFEKYDSLCKSRNETPNSVAKIIGASSGSVTAWKNGTVPRPATIVKIAEYFSVSVDFFLDSDKSAKKEQKNTPSEPELTEGEMAVLKLFRQVPEDQQQMVIAMIRAALSTDKQDRNEVTK